MNINTENLDLIAILKAIMKVIADFVDSILKKELDEEVYDAADKVVDALL